MYKYLLNLKTFDGEAAAGGEGSGAISSAAEANGSQPTGAEKSVDTTATIEPISFEQYMKDHKDEATKWFDKRFSRRHADYNRLAESNKASQGIMEMLAQKFGIEDATDISSIRQALENDDYLYAERAEENGRSVSEQREWDRLDRENKAYREQQKMNEQREAANRQYDAWIKESNNLKQVFPSFDLDVELENPDFVDALRAGLGVSRAFYSIHGADIAAGAMQQTAQEVRRATAEEIAAGKTRPRENGLSSRASVKVSKDLGQLTRQDRADLARRALKGERIRF